MLDVLDLVASLVAHRGLDHPNVDVHHGVGIALGLDVLRAVFGEVQPVVAERGVLGRADVAHLTLVEQHRAMTQGLDGGHVVGDQHDRLAGPAPVVEDIHALLGERGVTDGEHLVDQHDVGVGLNHDREGQADHHSRRVVLELQVDELRGARRNR